MAFPVVKLITSNKLDTLRPKINEIIDTFENFSFEDEDLFFTGSINQTEERLMVNQGETQAGSVGKLPGIEIDRGTETNQILIWNETTSQWVAGTESSQTALSLEGHLHNSDYHRNDEDIILDGNKIVNGESENGLLLDSGDAIIEGDITLRDSTNPTNFYIFNTYTDASNYERGFLKFESDILKLGVEHQNGTLPEMGIVQTGLMKFFSYQGTVNDDVSFTLPVISNSAWGFVTIGSNVEYSMFTIASDGTVTLISESTNVVSNADTDSNLCIGTSVASPVIIKNRLGSNYNVNMIVFYN